MDPEEGHIAQYTQHCENQVPWLRHRCTISSLQQVMNISSFGLSCNTSVPSTSDVTSHHADKEDIVSALFECTVVLPHNYGT